MATVITPTTDGGQKPNLFLAGTIEMGKSEDWQQSVIQELDEYNIVIANPRRGSFDQFNKEEILFQIKWELDKLQQSDIILFNLLPGTISPISLLEFGLLSGKRESKMIVCCPEEFSRHDNVMVTAMHEWAGSPLCEIHTDISSALESLRKYL